MKVRQSTIRQFGGCPRQYYYSEVLGLGKEQVGSLTVLGSIFHYALDVYETYGRDLDLAKRTFEYYWEHPGELGEKIDFWHRGSTFLSLLDRGTKMLEQFAELEPWRGQLVGTELHFEVPLGPHTLTGTIDKLWVHPGAKRLDVVDFKTGAVVPSKLRYHLQFTAYCYASMRPEFWAGIKGFEDGHLKFGGFVRDGWWYQARDNKMFNAGERTALDYKRLYLAVEAMEQTIEAGVFPLDANGENCGYCPFVESVCGSEMPNPVDL